MRCCRGTAAVRSSNMQRRHARPRGYRTSCLRSWATRCRRATPGCTRTMLANCNMPRMQRAVMRTCRATLSTWAGGCPKSHKTKGRHTIAKQRGQACSEVNWHTAYTHTRACVSMCAPLQDFQEQQPQRHVPDAPFLHDIMLGQPLGRFMSSLEWLGSWHIHFSNGAVHCKYAAHARRGHVWPALQWRERPATDGRFL